MTKNISPPILLLLLCFSLKNLNTLHCIAKVIKVLKFEYCKKPEFDSHDFQALSRFKKMPVL